MRLDLMERERFLLALDESLRRAAAGHGQLVLISGEAGIGKTSLIERFLEQCPPDTRTLWGACEALFTPRPLGPLYDIAQQTQAPLRAALEIPTNRATLFATVMHELSSSPVPTIVIIEDIHWADEATLDLITFLARRIHRTTAVLIVIYRDDEIAKEHPLRRVLGALPTTGVTRLRLPPLSETAVATLAQQADRPVKDLYRATGGNPFFLSEVLASDMPGVPTSVYDAVLAQVARRSAKAQRLLDLVSVVPQKIELGVIKTIDAGDSAALEECLAAGILHMEGGAVGFRHELARQSVEGALTPSRRQALHAEVLRALLDHGVAQTSLARLVHHAAQAEDGASVLRFAPAAAKQASSQGAHREASAHYVTALRYADSIDAEQRAELLAGLSQEYYLTGHIEAAIPPCESALALWQELGQGKHVGHTLRCLSRLCWVLGKNAEAEQHGMGAVDLLETLPPSRELAMAYGNLSHLRMLEHDTPQTLRWGGRAIELAERLHDSETISYVLNNVGTAQLVDSDQRGYAHLERSLQLALAHGYEEHVARAYANLANFTIVSRDYARATAYLQKGMAYCTERDLGSWSNCLRGHQARVRLDQGDWAGADEDATTILRSAWVDDRIPALMILGQLRARRGDPGAEAVLHEVRDLVRAPGVRDCLLAVAAIRAEWRWLQGDSDQCVAEAKEGLSLAFKHYPWYIGELAIWLWRGGELTKAPPATSSPFTLQLAGDWRAAAVQWEQLGCPYEQAMALLDGDEAALHHALALFDGFGATPAAEIARRRIGDGGVRGNPRGPRLTTQNNPQGLTNRQLEILLLLAEGLQNTEIADRLSTAPKTVEHHVSAVLAKLAVRSRTEAVRVAYQLDLVPQSAILPASKMVR